MNVLRYRLHELQSHITLHQWHHLVRVVNYEYEKNKHRNGSFYELYKTIHRYDPEEQVYKGHYSSVEDFLAKLRDIFYWWTHKVCGKIGQAADGTRRRVATKADTGFVKQFYICCYFLRTCFFIHKGGKAPRLGHYNVPRSFHQCLLGDPLSTRHEQWGIKFNELLCRGSQLQRTELILVPPPAFESVTLVIFSTVYQAFNSNDEYYLQASLYGEKEYGRVLMQEILLHQFVQDFFQWMVEKLEECEKKDAPPTGALFVPAVDYKDGACFGGSIGSKKFRLHLLSSVLSSAKAVIEVVEGVDEAAEEEMGVEEEVGVEEEGAVEEGAVDEINVSAQDLLHLTATTTTPNSQSKWEEVTNRTIKMLICTAIQTRKKQLGIEDSAEGFRQTLHILQAEGSLIRAQKDGLESLKKKMKVEVHVPVSGK